MKKRYDTEILVQMLYSAVRAPTHKTTNPIFCLNVRVRLVKSLNWKHAKIDVRMQSLLFLNTAASSSHFSASSISLLLRVLARNQTRQDLSDRTIMNVIFEIIKQ